MKFDDPDENSARLAMKSAIRIPTVSGAASAIFSRKIVRLVLEGEGQRGMNFKAISEIPEWDPQHSARGLEVGQRFDHSK
jgi:hypothetical protein